MHVEPLPPAASAAALSAVAACIRTLLGPQRTLKCAHATTTEPALISGDSLVVLDRLGLWHPAAVLLLEACEALQKQHGSGVTTLVCLTGELAASALELCRQVTASFLLVTSPHPVSPLCAPCHRASPSTL